MAQILVINGPNLNLLGTREVTHYGTDTLDSIEARLQTLAEAFGHDLSFYQDIRTKCSALSIFHSQFTKQ